MGYCWGVEVSLEYCVPIKLAEGVSFWYMLKRLAEYEPGYAKRAHDAAVTDEPLAKALQKRASQSIIVLRDSPEYREDEVNKKVENPSPLEKRFHYNPRLKRYAGAWFDGMNFCRIGDANWDELLEEAFNLAASKILGEGHGITLAFHHGSGYNGAEPPAKECGLFLTSGGFMSGGYMDFGCRGAVNGVPWGVQAMKVPAAPAGVAQKMERLMKAFGLEGEGDPDWRVVTVADMA